MEIRGITIAFSKNKAKQERITRSEQLPSAHVTAFSRNNLFLERFWGELEIFFKFLKTVSKTNRLQNDIFCLLITFSFLF